MKTWNRFLVASFGSLLGILFATACLAPSAFGQGRVDMYTATSFDAGWNDISASGTPFDLGDFRPWYQNPGYVSLPFDFTYDNTLVPAGSQITVSAAGTISFSNIDNYYNILGDQSSPGTLCYLSEYICTGDNNNYPNDNYYEVDGSYPNQVLTIQLVRMHFPGAGGGSGDGGSGYESNVQVKLYESTGVIEFVYMDHDWSYGPYDPWGTGFGIGLNGFTSPSFAYNTYSTGGITSPSEDVRFTPPAPPAQLSLQPKSLDFGSHPSGEITTMCVTASSVGSSPLHVTGFGISGSGASSYTIISGPPIGTEIDPGTSVQYCIQFQPLSPGVTKGIFTLVTDGKDSGTQAVSMKGIAAIPSVSYDATNLFHRTKVELGDTSQVEYIHVTSTGLGPLSFNSIYFIGLNANDYFVSRMPQNPLPPDATDSIGITFTPTIEGRPDASLVINTNAYNTPWDTVQLFGVGILPRIAIAVQPPGTGNTVAFDSVAIGDSVCQALTISNPGSDTLRIVKQLVTYGDYDFTYYPLTGADTMIVPGGSRLVNICFKPLKVGSRLASVRFYTNIPLTYESPRRDTNQFVVNITGIGVPFGQLAVLGSLNDTALVGTRNCITDTLRNTGQSDLTISRLDVAPATPNFTITGATVPFTLPPGGIQIVSLCFSATARGVETDTLLLSGVTSEKSISEGLLLNGVGVITCVSADPMITFGTPNLTLVDSVATSCITVTNCGDIAATYTASLPSGSDYTLVPPLTSAMVPAGGTAQFCVTFQPTAIGAAPGSVVISGGPNSTTTALGGVGAGVAATASGTLSTPVADGGCQSFDVTITDTGNVGWTPGNGTITGANAADFTITTQATPATIAPGGTATVTINFCPTTVDTEAMTLTFPNEIPVPVAGAFSYSTTAVGATSGVTIKTEQDGFVLGASYPNPTNGDAAIQLTLPNEAAVRIELLDATGALVRTVFTGNLGSGTQTLSIDAKGLPSGTYFYTLTSGDVRLTRQLSLIK